MRISSRSTRGFTLVELLTVIVIIMILVGMVIGAAGLVQEQQRINAARTNLKTLALALERYKDEMGEYPYASPVPGRSSPAMELDPVTSFNPGSYKPAIVDMGKALYNPYEEANGKPRTATDSYLRGLQPSVVEFNSDDVLQNIVDPWGNSFGYSVARAIQISEGEEPTAGYNPTYDLWSTGGGVSGGEVGKWITNW